MQDGKVKPGEGDGRSPRPTQPALQCRSHQASRRISSTALGALCTFCIFLIVVSCKRDARVVVIGVDNSPPFYVFQPDGSVRGLAIEVLSEAARRRNIQIHWVCITDASLDEALDSRRVQMWPAVGATVERKAKYFLSEPWIETDYVLVSPKHRPVRSIQETAGTTISHARLRGATILAHRYLPNSNLVEFPNRTAAFQAMCLGKAAAAFLESRMIETMLLDRPEDCSAVPLNISNVPGATTLLSIAALPESATLARELRTEISKMALEGELVAILDKWAPFSAAVARSIALERTGAVRNQYLTILAGCLLVSAMLMGLLANRAYKLRRLAMAAEKEIRRRAAEDVLTRLSNRTVLTEHLTRCIKQSNRGGARTFGVMFLDLDDFKVINDSLGHLAGDQLLVGIAQRLKRTVRSSDLVGNLSGASTVARFGGDEFVVLVEDIQSLEHALLIAERIQHDLGAPFLLDGQSVFATFSIGIALSSHDYDSADDLLRDADTAMYVAKTSGKARLAVFDSAMRARAVARLEIETDLRIALAASDGLVVHYQPQVNLRSGEIVGFEALVRWQHPKYGLIPPIDFIPIAEETGLIVPLGAWVLEEACSQMQRWHSSFSDFSNLKISVNISGKQLSSMDLFRDVEQALRASLLPPECLDLEITESFLMENTEAAVQALLNLKSLGIGLQIDDFGTGYSSLHCLHNLPFDTLKIDRSFIHSIGALNNGIEIVRTIMALAQRLNMGVVAEGIENQTQMSHLQQMGCVLGQGFYFSKPLDANSAGKLLAAKSRAGSTRPELLLA
jgi:diguanylate cyclase (GGDEF)-like protein